MALRDDRTPSWRIVTAGAPITANQYHCATVPDGPNSNGMVANISGSNSAIGVRPLNPRIEMPIVAMPDGERLSFSDDIPHADWQFRSYGSERAT